MTDPYVYTVRFGDCDPAGIAFYPNIFRWMDATFHAALAPFGGHAEICRKLDSLGLGIADAQTNFKSPLRDGDVLEIRLNWTEWSSRSVTISYLGSCGGRLAFSGREVRCLFKATPSGMVAGEVTGLRKMIDTGNG